MNHFVLDSYLEHCLETYHKYKCNEAIYRRYNEQPLQVHIHQEATLMDIVGQEQTLQYNVLNNGIILSKATVIISIHDRLIMRKAYSSGLSKMWIKRLC
jgi:hypothetical protein